MTQHSLAELIEKLMKLAPARGPASQANLESAEQQLGIHISDDFAFLYRRLNGTTEPTHPDNGWIQLWPVERWYTVAEYVGDWSERDRGAFRQIFSAVVFADYSLGSWHYAASFSTKAREQAAPIYLLHLKPYLVGESLGAFLAAALVDGPEIYPRD